MFDWALNTPLGNLPLGNSNPLQLFLKGRQKRLSHPKFCEEFYLLRIALQKLFYFGDHEACRNSSQDILLYKTFCLKEILKKNFLLERNLSEKFFV